MRAESGEKILFVSQDLRLLRLSGDLDNVALLANTLSIDERVKKAGMHTEIWNCEIAALVTTLTGERWDQDPQARQAALAVIALTSGGLSLARALGKTALSDEVLQACRGFAEQTLAKRK